MKQVGVFTVVVFGLCAAASALPAVRSKAYLEASSLKSFAVDPILRADAKRARSGTVRVVHGVDGASARVELTVEFAPPRCPPGMKCRQSMPMPLRVDLAVEREYYDNCGMRIIEAWGEVDRVIQRLQLADSKDNRCPTLVALPPLEVRFQTREAPRFTTRSSFTGEHLERARY